MSYSITINGHRDFDTDEERAAFDVNVQAIAARFAAELEGVTTATADTATTGRIDLLATA